MLQLDYFSIEKKGIRAMRRRRLNVLADLSRIYQADNPNVQSALRRVADRNVGKPIEHAYRQIINSLKSGMENGVSAALRPYFPEREFLLVKAFDMGAKDDKERGEGLAIAASIMRPLDALRTGFLKLAGATLMSILLVLVLWLGFAPFFAELMGDLVPRDKWFFITKAVVRSAEIVRSWWMIGVPILIGFVVWVIWALPNWRGSTRRWMDQRVPGFFIYREYSSILTLVALASFLRANQGFDWAFKQLLRLGTRWESDYIDAVKKRSTQYGASKMLDVGYFPDEVIDRIALREGTDSLEQNLANVALQNVTELTGAMTERLNVARGLSGDITKALGGLIVVAIMLLMVATMTILTATPRS
jgi:type II secretory pathway component PulF